MSYIINISAINNSSIIDLPRSFNISSTTEVINLLCYISRLKLCPGNCEPKFQKLALEKVGDYTDRYGNS